MSTDEHGPPPPSRRARRRRVAFGNPSLSVFGGFVDTLDACSINNDALDDDAIHVQHVGSSSGGVQLGRVVAMIDVPPEQVPEGILNFVRAHRPVIEHVRIVTTDHDDDGDDGGDGGESENDVGAANEGTCDDNINNEEDQGGGIGSRLRSASFGPAIASAAAVSKSSSAPVSGNFGPSAAADGVAMSYQQQQQQQQQLAQGIPFGRYRSQSFSTAAGSAYGYKYDQSGQISDNNMGYGETKVGADLDVNFDAKGAVEHHDVDDDSIDGGGDDDDNDRLEALKRLEAYAAASDSDASEFDEMFDDDDRHLHHGQAERCKSYVVLFQLTSVEAAVEFVHDLDGRPYTTLQEDVTCCLCHVLSLRGDGGVSLMSPFFAPSSMVENSGGDGSTKKGGANFSTPTKGLVLDAVRETLSGERRDSSPNAVNSTGSKDQTPSPPPAITELGGAGASRNRRARSPIGFASGAVGGGVSHVSEAHNCAVCLERLEMEPAGKGLPSVGSSATGSAQHHGSGIITTVCNHTFHIDCLLQWQDSPCPVCRFDHSGLNEALSQCHICGVTEHNYVCLICGVVSCGGGGQSADAISSGATNDSVDFGSNPNTRSGSSANGTKSRCNAESESGAAEYDQNDEDAEIPRPLPPVATGHARRHYDETLHAYALDTETQHVWDFAGQGYVHRLIQNKDDGKLVETNDPSNTSSQARTLDPGLSDAQEDELVHRKLEGFASQYYTVLKGQLEQQRIFYESQLEEIRREYDVVTDPKRRYAQELISALKQEKNQIEQRCLTLRRKLRKAEEDISFLKNMNESLASDKEPMKREITEAQRQRTETRDMLMKCLPPLEAKLAMLFTQLEGGGGTQGVQEAADCEGDMKPAAK